MRSKAEWQAEKALLEEQRKVKEELDKARTELEQAQRRGELGKASEIQYGRIPALERKLEQLMAEANGKGRLLREEVTEEDIAEVVSSWTHIPVSRLQEGEREKLMKLEEHLSPARGWSGRSDHRRVERRPSRPRRFAG